MLQKAPVDGPALQQVRPRCLVIYALIVEEQAREEADVPAAVVAAGVAASVLARDVGLMQHLLHVREHAAAHLGPLLRRQVIPHPVHRSEPAQARVGVPVDGLVGGIAGVVVVEAGPEHIADALEAFGGWFDPVDHGRTERLRPPVPHVHLAACARSRERQGVRDAGRRPPAA